ncbi:hypothetical protein FOL47_004254 [Perkinsus chesapeaki]|uniref:Nudix hydrolase domain-containing protein n=1 Tax=Perkinsus chesapeaki TaxID=330153 RepID=A0A7J6M513_PERCH|nr:hypothetical protein FOL47_004254 [Perkinsus chesapeaki]
MSSLTLPEIAARLAQQSPLLSAAKLAVKSRAMVACILRPGPRLVDSAEMLLIRRAAREGDPWSGQTAFPGGRCDLEDGGCDLATVTREVQEEIGLNLANEEHYRLLGRIRDLETFRSNRAVRMVVGCFVFEQLRPEPLELAVNEVAACGWLPVAAVACAREEDVKEVQWSIPNADPAYWYFRLLGLTEVTLPSLVVSLKDATKASPDVEVTSLNLWGITMCFTQILTMDTSRALLPYRTVPIVGWRVPHIFNPLIHDLTFSLYRAACRKEDLTEHASGIILSYLRFFHCLCGAAAFTAAAGLSYLGIRSKL